MDLEFAVNGEIFKIDSVDPSTTLLEFLRFSTPFKSVKLGCGEGKSLSLLCFYLLVKIYCSLTVIKGPETNYMCCC